MEFLRLILRIVPRLRCFFYQIWNPLWFKINGVNYGRNLVVNGKIYIIGHGEVTIGDDFTFSSGECVNPISRNIRGAIYTVTREARIVIGDRVGISSACMWAQKGIFIGDDVNIGADCLLIDNDAHPHDYKKRRMESMRQCNIKEYQESIPSSPIVIDDDVWIGARCQILKGVHIGARSIIAAGSVVVKDIPNDVLAGGCPCRIIRPL